MKRVWDTAPSGADCCGVVPAGDAASDADAKMESRSGMPVAGGDTEDTARRGEDGVCGDVVGSPSLASSADRADMDVDAGLTCTAGTGDGTGRDCECAGAGVVAHVAGLRLNSSG